MAMEREPLIHGRFRLGKVLGKGAFGEVREATDVRTGMRFAVKLEGKDTFYPQLRKEVEILRHLQFPGFPHISAYGHTDSHNYLIEELLSDDLSAVIKRPLSPSLAIDIVSQCIRRVETMHKASFLHNDIKPQNFCMGVDGEMVYLTDFGLGKRFEEGKNKVHVPYRENISFVGTATYASLNVLMGVQPSRRDDLESVLLLAIRLLKGRLPWERLGEKRNSTKIASIRKLKLTLPLEELCRGLSPYVLQAFKYVRELKFAQQPDYEFIRELLGRDKLQHGAAQDSHLYGRRKSHHSHLTLAPSSDQSHPPTVPIFSLHFSSGSRRTLNIPPQQPTTCDDSPTDDDSEELTVKVETLPAFRRDFRRTAPQADFQ